MSFVTVVLKVLLLIISGAMVFLVFIALLFVVYRAVLHLVLLIYLLLNTCLLLSKFNIYVKEERHVDLKSSID